MAGPRPAARRSRLALAAIAIAGLVMATGLAALGTWQVQRRAWKHDLVARVEARVRADPVEAPGPGAWDGLTAEADAYRRVRASGRFRNDRETLVQAVTDLGAGFWVLTPLARGDGTMILVNRGFVPQNRRDPAARADGQIGGETTVTGLLRLTEPGGAFLRSNAPEAGRWYSRDVAAIAAAQGLTRVAPYFIDADATPNPGGWPVGGLTIVHFPDNHLVYALTWYVLALMVLGAVGYTLIDARRGGRRASA
ncbi:Surfeit locus 1 family protein [Methylobacterium sp. Leaf104]|uniref:SURF1 family protein n=1 Tax=Methylobacterium TaxID=407 RepID=UPI0006F632B9|nr:Surfeit locus 1 family protein [Methylobacterium sp. Leaf104]MCI9879949.1 SURF1 family protein [Methylobacterium goesingense]